MRKELLQHTWWALVRGSRGLPGSPQGFTVPQFGKHCFKRIVATLAFSFSDKEAKQ